MPPLVGFPCRCGFRCAFRGGALWRCLTRNLLVLRLLRRYAYIIRHITYLLFGGRWRCCCLCVFFMHDMQHTCVLVRLLFSFVVIPFAYVLRRRRIPCVSRLALFGQGTEEKGTTAGATTHTQEGNTTTGGPAPPHPHKLPTTPGDAPPNTHHRSKHRTPCRSHQRTPTSHWKPHGEWRAHPHGENRPHPQRKPQGTPLHGAPPRPHRQATTPATTRATSQAPEGTATAARTRDQNPQRTRDQGTGPQGGQPHGPSRD